MYPLNVVQIVGAPVACGDGIKEDWRDIATLAQTQLSRRFGDTIRVDYFDLFDPGCPPLSPEAHLPVVFINGQPFSSGGKISIPAIRKRNEYNLDVWITQSFNGKVRGPIFLGAQDLTNAGFVPLKSQE